ncbi:MAG: hypothetical protein RL240_4279 [Planctomycetota bacterium]
MSAHHRNPPAILGAFVLLLCLGTDLAAQSPYAPATAGDSVQQQPQSLIRKFTFKHAKAADVLKILQQLAGPTDHIGLKIAVDERTNSLVFQPEDDRQARYFEETCTLLDAETPAPGDPGKGLSISVPALGPQPLAFDFAFGIARGESLESLKQRYNELEQQTHQLADKLKQSKSPSEPERAELTTAVRKSFEARQALQRAELADLAQRMKSMQQSIDMRDKLADKVVQRRVEDLLNPGLKWDAGKVSEQLLVVPNQVSSNPATPLPPSALPSNLSAPYVPGERAETVIRKKIQGRWIVQTLSDGNKDALADLPEQMEVDIDGNSMRYLVGKQDEGRLFLADCKEVLSPTLTENGPLPIDFIHDPNGDPQTIRGIIACDGTTLSICMASDEGRANKDFRPSLFVPGTKVTLLKCHRAEPETAKAVSVDKTTWKSAVQHATSKLLAAFPVPPAIDQNDAPKVIAIVDVDYQGTKEVGNLLEEICKWIAADIPFARVHGSYALLSRSAVKLAMQETGLRPRDLTRSNPNYVDNRLQLLKQLRSQELKVDALLTTSLKHLEDVEDAYPSQFEITLEGFIDAQTSWFERVTLKGKANGPFKEPESNSLRQFATPQELLAGLDDFSKNGMHEEFVTLFGDDGIRDLAGSLLISAVQLSESVEYAKNHGADTETAIEESVTKVREVLGKWLPGNTTAEAIATMRGLEQQAVNEAFGTGEAPTDDSSLKVFVTAVRKSSERITNHRKFAVEIMRAFDGMTNNKFAYFDQGNTKAVWQVSQFGDRALGTLVDGTASFATITLERAKGTWRISSMFNELLTMTNANAEREKPSTPAMEMQQRLQGEWNVKVFQSDGEGSEGQAYQVVIRGNILLLQTVVNGKVIGAYPYKLVWPNSGHPYEVDVIHDPNANKVAAPGRIACDNNSFQIVFGGPKSGDGNIRRPSEICPVENAVYVDCARNVVDHRRAPIAPLKTSELSAVDLSTPQATLDTIDRYSIDHPMGVPVECYTETALQELSGVMLQQLCFMSGLSQVGLQTGGVIGVKDNAPIVAGTAPSFHLSVDALLKDHSLPTPPEECTKAFELLAKLTLGAAFGSDESLVKPDRELFRLAAGILKSPKEFLPKAGELSERFNNISGDTESPKKESKAQPKYLIEIDGDEATATQIVDTDKPSVPMSFKLQRINQRWLVSEAFSDEILSQMISSMSQVLGAMSANESEVANQRDSSDSKKAPDAEGANNASPPNWNEFLKLLPESGTALVMFSYEPEIKEQMLPLAKKVTEAASAQLIELPQIAWHKIIAPPATHFVLMKDRQLVGTRTGLMTEARLQDFVAKAKDWLTPQSTAIEENSLVRIDCYISPGTGNAGSQHGGALPFTSAVIAVHEDQALLLGPDSIAGYIEKGYACVAVVRDAAGKQKQLPLDVLFKGPLKLLGRNTQAPTLQGSVRVKDGDGTLREVPLVSIYPESVTQPLEAYDVDSAIYHIRGVRGLTPTKLAAIDAVPKVDQPVLSGGFARDRHLPPIHGFSSPILWQTQTVQSVGAIYGENMNGAELFTVSCPGRPAPVGFTFNEHGRLIGRYGLGSPTDKDMTHTVFQAYATHSILHACLDKIDDPGLKAALAQTLEESNTAAFIKEENSPAAGDAANASTLQSSTSPPIKFDTPQALLARVDECSKNGSYEEFVSLFSDEGVRDLAGSLIVSAMQVTTVTELAKQNGGDLGQGPARIQEALNRWLKPNPTPEQQQAVNEAFSLMFLVGVGGPVQDKSEITAYVAGIRKSAERVTDFRKFSVDMLKAYHELTGEPFGYFSKEKDREWHVTQSADKAVATLVVKTEPTPALVGIGSNIAEQSSTSNGSEQLPVMTLTKLDGTWRISSLFDELLNVVEPKIEAPSAAAPE